MFRLKIPSDLWLKKIFSGSTGNVHQREQGTGISVGTMQIRDLPSLDEILQKPEAIPEEYSQFFLPTPLEEEELFIGRNEELGHIEEAFTHWQSGKETSVVIVGPQGSGKTSIVNNFLRTLFSNYKVKRGRLENRLQNEGDVISFMSSFLQLETNQDNLNNLVAELLKLEPRVFVLEGMHNLLLRVIGGRQAAETFFYLIMATRQRHFWLVSCRRLPWNNLDRHAEASRYFSHVIAVDFMNRETLREALILRQKKVDCQIVFNPGEAEPGREKENDEQDKSEKVFYDAVMDNSGNNFQSALYFWLISCRFDSKTRTVILKPPDHLDTAMVRDMGHFNLLTIAEIAGHGNLSVEEHQKIFRTSGLQSRLTLEFLRQVNLIEEVKTEVSGQDVRYEISPVIYHAITPVLEQFNFLY